MDFKGRWINTEGNVLVIKTFGRRYYRVKFIRKDNKLLLWNRIKLFISMFPFGCFGKKSGNDLLVDVGGPLGPALCLKPALSENDGSEILLPEIVASISDGWEDVLGIAWLEPLSPFRKSS
jgi:hypothetical protein